jgi:hypothetical protein
VLEGLDFVAEWLSLKRKAAIEQEDGGETAHKQGG